MRELSHVGMDLCFYCQEPRGVVLDRRLLNRLPRQAVYGMDPCDECKAHMANGIILISMDEKLTQDKTNPYRSGGWVVVTDEAFQRIFSGPEADEAFKKRVAFLPNEVWDTVGLPERNRA